MAITLSEYIMLQDTMKDLIKEQISSETSETNKQGGYYEEYDEDGNLIFTANFKNGLLKGYIEGIGNIALKKPEND